MACAARGVSPYDYLETDMRIRTQEPAKGAACGGSPAWQGPAHLAGICRSAATPSSLYSTAPGRAPKTSSSGSKSAAVHVADHACRHPRRFAATNPEPLRRTPQRYSSCSQGARRSAAHQLRSAQALRTFSPARDSVAPQAGCQSYMWRQCGGHRTWCRPAGGQLRQLLRQRALRHCVLPELPVHQTRSGSPSPQAVSLATPCYGWASVFRG